MSEMLTLPDGTPFDPDVTEIWSCKREDVKSWTPEDRARLLLVVSKIFQFDTKASNDTNND